MNHKEILLESFKKHNCENILSPDGRAFDAILEAMNIVSGYAAVQNTQKTSNTLTQIVDEDLNPVDKKILIELLFLASSAEDFINKVNYFITNKKSVVSEYNNNLIKDWYQENVLSEREINFNLAAAKVRNEIDYSKHGAIVESFFRFAKEMNGVTFSELNMFYCDKNCKTYDSVRDRGGSLTKHLISLRDWKKRLYSGETKRLRKEGKLWVSSK